MNKNILSGLLLSTFVLTSSIVPSFAQTTTEDSTALVAQSTQTLSTASESDFVFNKGVISKYNGKGGDVVIPSTINGETVISIAYTAFAEHRQVTSVVIPDTVTTLGKEAFKNCTALTSVTLSQNITVINENTFLNCSSLTSIALPDKLTKISEYAFDNCTALTTISMPDTISVLGKHAFRNCTSMTFAKLPIYIINIPEGLFLGSSSLNYVKIPSSVKTIEKEAFKNTALSSISIPTSVTSIADSTFENTKLLTLTIPNSVTYVGRYAFAGCSSLVYLSLPSSLTTVDAYGFARCTSLQGVYFPDTLKEIGNSAFKDCGGNPTILYGSANSLAKSYSTANSLRYIDGTDPSAPDLSAKTASPSTAKVTVNEVSVPFAAYTIEGFNYFKLTDMAYALDQTAKEFQVTWDGDRSAINMVTGKGHINLGTELQGNSGKNETAERFMSTVYKNGSPILVTVYTIDGSSYFQLDTLKEVLGLNVGWNSSTSTISIKT